MEQEVQGVVEEERAEVAAAPASESVPENPIAPHWLRLGLAVEFLVALIAVTVTWEEIGGQGHLDLMPWYLKLAMIGGFCWAFVRFSAALARPGKWRNWRSLGWLCAVFALLAAMGRGVTRKQTVELLELVAKKLPRGAIRTAFIAGYPDRPATGAHL